MRARGKAYRFAMLCAVECAPMDPVDVALSNRGVDPMRLMPPGGSGGRLLSLSRLGLFFPSSVVVDDTAEGTSNSSRGVEGMGMLSVEAVDEGVLSSSFDVRRMTGAGVRYTPP